jgi:hypothetical protein
MPLIRCPFRTVPTIHHAMPLKVHHDGSAIIMLPTTRATATKLDGVTNTAGVRTLTVASAVRKANWSNIGAENGTVSGSLFTAHVTHNHAAVASVDGAGLACMVVPVTPTTRPFDPAPYTNTTTVVSSSC